jgi:hypothetical protein
MNLQPGHDHTPHGIPYEYTFLRQDLDDSRAVVAGAVPAFKVTTLTPLDVPGEPLIQKTVYTVPAEQLHEFLTHPRWQDTSETIVLVAPA